MWVKGRPDSMGFDRKRAGDRPALTVKHLILELHLKKTEIVPYLIDSLHIKKQLFQILRIQAFQFGYNEQAVLADKDVVEPDFSAAVFRALNHYKVPVDG